MTVFVDSNIPMYVVGAEHPNKQAAVGLLDAAVSRSERMATDVEVLQEILHRYGALGRPEAIQPAFELLLGLVDDVLAVDLADVEAAKRVLLGG